MTRLIVNADDFGASRGVNRGIAEAHLHGIVTSTSVMTTGRAIREAVAMSRDLPGLSLGLHWDVFGEDERSFDLEDLDAARDEFHRQLGDFRDWFGRDPTHVDSHRHAHRHPRLLPLFQALVEPLGVPLRHSGEIPFVGDFYAQWEWQVTNLEYVSVPFLIDLLRRKARGPWVEFSCHPGYPSPDYQAVYLAEREHEVRSLTDARVREEITALGLHLASFGEYRTARLEAGAR